MTLHLWDMYWAAILGSIVGSAVDPVLSIPAIVVGWYFKNRPLAVLFGAVMVSLAGIALAASMSGEVPRIVYIEAQFLAVVIIAFAAFGVRKLFPSPKNKEAKNIE